MELTVYLHEDQPGKVAPGTTVAVKVDAYPERSIKGTVLQLGDEIEFTPNNAQTKEGRVRLVYAVKIRLDNPDLALRPGMIADLEY